MQYVALASSQLHFMDTFNAGFLEEKKKTFSLLALLRLQSLSISLLRLISKTAIGILFTWAFTSSAWSIDELCLIHTLTYTHELPFIPQGNFYHK